MRWGGRRPALVVAALGGVLAGAVATTALVDSGRPPAPAAPRATTSTTTTTTAPATTTSSEPRARHDVLLVWTAGGLDPGLLEELDGVADVERVALVRGDEVRLTGSTDGVGVPVDDVPDGWFVPLDALAVDPADFSSFLDGADAALVGGLTPGRALLTRTSARLRRLGEGATLHLTSGDVTVAGVIDDGAGAGAEVLLPDPGAEVVGVTTPRYLLVAHAGDRRTIQQEVARRLHGRSVRFRTPDETQWLRHGDAVEPQAAMKAAFGEFAVRDRPGRDVEIDPEWIERAVTTEPVPVLGSATCHRLVLPPLRAAMAAVDGAGLAHLIDPTNFAGCFNARRTGPGGALSHHAWGAALDINVGDNPRGSFSTQDPRLVEVMEAHGFRWGGTWLVPDPAHYEAPVPGG